MAEESPRQDMPPPGGYRKFNWARTYPKVLIRRKFILKRSINVIRILAFVAIPATIVFTAMGIYQARAHHKRIKYAKINCYFK